MAVGYVAVLTPAQARTMAKLFEDWLRHHQKAPSMTHLHWQDRLVAAEVYEHLKTFLEATDAYEAVRPRLSPADAETKARLGGFSGGVDGDNSAGDH